MTVSFVLSMIMAAILATFTVGQRSMDQVEARTELYQTARLVHARLERELSSLWVPFPETEAVPAESELNPQTGVGTELGTEQGNLPTAIEGTTNEQGPIVGMAPDSARNQSARIEFTTALPPEFGESRHRVDVARVSYWVDLDPATPEEGLVRAVDRYPGLGDPEKTTEIEIYAEHVTDLEIRYYNADEDEWTEEWDSETLPTAVLFTITVDNKNDKEDPVIVSGTVALTRTRGGTVGEAFEGSQTLGEGGSAGTASEGASQGPSAEEMENLINQVSAGGGGP